MIVQKYRDVEKKEVISEGVKNTHIRWLIGDNSGAPNFYLRLFEIEANGHTPFHTHPWEHEVYILEGEGKLNTAGGNSHSIGKGSFALVLPNEEHQFENTGDLPLKFLCVIPTSGK